MPIIWHVRKSLILTGILLTLSAVSPQTTVPDSTQTVTVGYLVLQSDSLGVPLFVDNVLVGTTPLAAPIPLLPGFHEVSYLPPQLNTAKLENELGDAIKRIYIPPDDTVRVTLYYQSQVEHIRALQMENTVSTYIGFMMITVVLLILWQIT